LCRTRRNQILWEGEGCQIGFGTAPDPKATICISNIRLSGEAEKVFLQYADNPSVATGGWVELPDTGRVCIGVGNAVLNLTCFGDGD